MDIKPTLFFKKFPKEIKFEYKLGSYQKFLSTYYPKIIFCYKGQIVINKLLKSINDALNYHYILLSNFKKDKNDLYLSYDLNNQKHIEKEFLEIEYINSSIDGKDSNTSNYFSNKLSNLLDNFGFVKIYDDVPLCFLKLTVFNDGYVFSFCGSHSIVDTFTANCFLKKVSDFYNSDNQPTVNEFSKKHVPVYYNTNDLIEKSYKSDKSKLEEYFYSKFGYIHQSKIPHFIEKNEIDKYYFNNSIVKLKFNLNQFNSYLSQCNQYKLSKNDLIHAILLKAFTFTNFLTNKDSFTLRYICNARRLLNMNDEYLGSVIHINKLQLNVKDIRNSNLIELAIKSNNHLKLLNKNEFIENLSWYELVSNENQDASNYACLPSFFSTSVSNWTGYNYNSIKFGNQTPIVNKTNCIAAFGVNTITFEYENNVKYYTTNIAIPTNCIEKLNDLSNSTKLFKTENILIKK